LQNFTTNRMVVLSGDWCSKIWKILSFGINFQIFFHLFFYHFQNLIIHIINIKNLKISQELRWQILKVDWCYEIWKIHSFCNTFFNYFSYFLLFTI